MGGCCSSAKDSQSFYPEEHDKALTLFSGTMRRNYGGQDAPLKAPFANGHTGAADSDSAVPTLPLRRQLWCSGTESD